MLKKETEDLWRSLQPRPELTGFVLVGGSALALRIGHRISEDLDFAWTGPRLPRERLQLLIAGSSNDSFVAADDPVALQEADDCGMDLHDFSQTLLVNNTTRVTFFVLDPPERRILSGYIDQLPQLAALEEIFALKSLVCAKRSKTRDWFDLFILMRDHGFTFSQFHQVFVDAEESEAYDLAVARLCNGRPNLSDEGFESLLPDPPTLEVMGQFFRSRKNAYEQDLAEKEARRKFDGEVL